MVERRESWVEVGPPRPRATVWVEVGGVPVVGDAAASRPRLGARVTVRRRRRLPTVPRLAVLVPRT